MAGLRTAIVTRVVDPVIWKMKGTPIGARLRDFQKHQWDDPETFRARRAELLRELLLHAVTRVPLYRERDGAPTPEAIETDPFAALASMPILERDDVRDRAEDLRIELGLGAAPDHTSGSTGMPLDFVRDRPSITAAYAATLLAFDWAGIRRGDRRIRYWGPLTQHQAEHGRIKKIVDWLHQRAVVDSYQMTDEKMREYIRILNDSPPASLEGYPEGLQRIAEYAREHGITVPSPAAIIVGGALLHDHTRAVLKEVFRAPVFEQYGSREVGLMAAECDRHQGLHVMGETTILEILNDDGNPVPDGEVGRIIVTHLSNYSMPFIRYNTGDHGALAPEPCPCGRVYPLLGNVVGRTGECFVSADGAPIIPECLIQIGAWEFSTRNVRKFQVVQEAIDHVVVRMVPSPGTEGWSTEEREGITRRIREFIGGPVRVDFVVEEDIEFAPSGKFFYTLSKISDERTD
jgi:phenylacetate-CoA ligase